MDLESIDSHFQEIENVENIPLDRKVLHLTTKQGSLDAKDLQFAYQKSPLYPSRSEWLLLAYRFFMAAGILLLMSGIVFFFAYNWGGLHKFAKLALVQTGIIAVASGLLFFKPSEFIIKLGLTTISVLTGVLFAVFGQIYQTGADAYDFFLGWTIFITAWVAISSFPFLWFFYLLLINMTITLYLIQVDGVSDQYTYYFVLTLINSIALGIWEYLIKANRQVWVHLLCIRIIGMFVISVLTVALTSVIFDHRSSGLSVILILFYLFWIVGGALYYVKKEKDISFLAMISISVLIIVNFMIVRFFDNSFDYISMFFFLSFLNIAATTILVINLMKVNKKWKLENKKTYE